MGGRYHLPVAPDLNEQAIGEGDVAILAAFPLLHADAQPLGIDVGDLEGDDLADAQAGGVGGGEQEAMLR